MNIDALKSWRLWVQTAFIALAAALPVAFYLKTYDSVAIKYTIMQLGAILALTAWLAGGLAEERFELPEKTLPFAAPAAALLVWNFARFLAAPYKAAAFDGFLTQELFLVSFLLALLSFSERELKKIAAAAAGAWAVAVLYGAAQYLGLDPFIWKGAFGPNIFSTIGNPDYFAAYLTVASPFALMLLADATLPRPLRAVAGLLAVIGGIVVALTGAGLEALIYVAVQTGFILLAFNRLEVQARKPAVLAAALAAAACVAAFVLLAPKPSQFSSNRPITSEIRKSSFAMAKNSGWLGFGPGSFQVHYPSFRSREELVLHHKHNILAKHAGSEVLEQWAEGGLPGLLLWLAVFGTVLYKGFKARAPGELSGYACGLLVSVAGSLAVCLVALNTPRSPSVGWLMYVNAGLLALLAASAAGKPEKVLAVPVPSAALRRLLMAAVLAAGGFSAYYALRMFRSDAYHNHGIFNSKNGDWARALSAYGKEAPGARTYVQGQYFTGMILLDRGGAGDLERAVERYRKVRSLFPDYVQVHFKEASALRKLDRVPEAIERLERQVLLDPVWEDAWKMLAGLYAETGAVEKARHAEQKAGDAKALWESEAAPAPAAGKPGESGGIGIKALFSEGDLLVEEVAPNGPADKAGIKPGDQILEIIAAVPTGSWKFTPRKFTPEQAAAELTGQPGAKVTLVVLPKARRRAALKAEERYEARVIRLQRVRTRQLRENISRETALRVIAETRSF